MATKAQRHDRITRLIHTASIHSQQELQRRLAASGIETTQATLSRDLQELGVFKGPDGYVLPPSSIHTTRHSSNRHGEFSEVLQRTLRREVRSIDYSGNMVVIRTDAGHANALAVEIDRAQLPEALGTLAGDDTIAVIVSRSHSAAQFTRRLRSMV